MSFTFVGFTVTEKGDLMNPITNTVMEPAIMTSQLYNGLDKNKVKLQDNYKNWTEPEIIVKKLARVMGVTKPDNPDGSYVLTVDNFIKILAIQMRFRQVLTVLLAV